MLILRRWSVRHARWLETFYNGFENCLRALRPVIKRIGFARLEKPFAATERAVKGALFDCKMCGQCALTSTGMSCPMNCPKNLRNGPCGGVRSNGNCEVIADMPCVWVEAWKGSQTMQRHDAIHTVQPAVDFRLKDRSAWLRVIRDK
jgi:hypothetical protein